MPFPFLAKRDSTKTDDLTATAVFAEASYLLGFGKF